MLFLCEINAEQFRVFLVGQSMEVTETLEFCLEQSSRGKGLRGDKQDDLVRPQGIWVHNWKRSCSICHRRFQCYQPSQKSSPAPPVAILPQFLLFYSPNFLFLLFCSLWATWRIWPLQAFESRLISSQLPQKPSSKGWGKSVIHKTPQQGGSRTLRPGEAQHYWLWMDTWEAEQGPLLNKLNSIGVRSCPWLHTNVDPICHQETLNT